MAIVLINPPVTKKIWGNLEKAGSILPPLGLCSLASVLRENNIECRIIDAIALKLTYKDILKEIKEYSPKYVGITSTTSLIENAGELAKEIKEYSKDIKIIIGGSHVSALPIETLTKYPFDIGVIGEGEKTIVEIFKKDLKKVDGLIIKKGKKLKLTKPREFIKNLDSLPFPAWDLLSDFKLYRPAITNYKRLPTTSLITSRGCFGKCTFCSKKVFGSVCRFFSAEYVINMIKFLKDNYGIKDICFYDDNFLLNKKRVEKICELIKEEKLDITWSCDARVDLVDLKLLKLMKKAGCWEINFGLESGSNEILKNIKKNTTVEQNKRAIKLTKEAKIDVRGFFMLGCPGETKETLEETYNFIKKSDIDEILISFFTIIPGSEIYDTSKYKWGASMYSPSYIPEGVSKEILEEYYKKIYKSFYLNPKRIIKYSKKIKDFKKLKDSFLAFIKAVR